MKDSVDSILREIHAWSDETELMVLLDRVNAAHEREVLEERLEEAKFWEVQHCVGKTGRVTDLERDLERMIERAIRKEREGR